MDHYKHFPVFVLVTINLTCCLEGTTCQAFKLFPDCQSSEL